MANFNGGFANVAWHEVNSLLDTVEIADSPVWESTGNGDTRNIPL